MANRFLFENDRLKMWHLDLQPGESSDWHVHDLDYVTDRVTNIGTPHYRNVLAELKK